MSKSFIHTLDSEITENVKNMLQSADHGDIKLALEILNNTDLSDFETTEHLKTLMTDAECMLCFDIKYANDDKKDIYLHFNSAKL
jgi:hypothetical protein